MCVHAIKSGDSPACRRSCRSLDSSCDEEVAGTGALTDGFCIHLLDLGCILISHKTRGMLPRKEVIQPQLPLRLPCYDFVPIIHPTFDGCLPCGLAHRLQVLPTFVT